MSRSGGTRSAARPGSDMAARGLSLTAPLMALALTGMWSAERLSASDPAESAFEQVLAKSNNVAPPPYRAYRRMEGGLNDSEKRGWVEAWTEYAPGRGFTYEVVNEGGSDYVRNKILRGMLNSEQNLIATGKRLRASLEAKNYRFEDGGIGWRVDDVGMVASTRLPAPRGAGRTRARLTLAFDQTNVTRTRSLGGVFRRELHTLSLTQ